MSPRRAFLDACVLYPPLVRGLLLSAAVEGLLIPLWSPRVAEEWARASLRDLGPPAANAARAEAALMARRWPEGLAEPETTLPPLDLPDPDDVHVLAAALAARADLLVTFNLRDFPAPKLRGLGLAPIHPDALLWELAGQAPEALSRALARALTPFPHLAENAPQTVRALRRAGLPRLAKLLRAGQLTPES